MLQPFQFKDLDTAEPIPTPETDIGTFEALPLSKPDTSDWQALSFQPLQGGGEATPSPVIHDQGHEFLQAAPEAPPEAEFEVQQPAPIIDRAHLEALEQAARETGYAEGFAQGSEAGQKEGLELATAQAELDRRDLIALTQGLINAESDLFKAIKTDLIKLLQIVPRQIIGRELSVRPNAVVEMAEALLNAFASQRHLTLRAHPEDVKLLEHIIVISANEDESRLTLLPDPTLRRADLRLITESGEIDASIETQLARYDKQVEEWIKGSHDDDAKGDEGLR